MRKNAPPAREKSKLDWTKGGLDRNLDGFIQRGERENAGQFIFCTTIGVVTASIILLTRNACARAHHVLPISLN